MAFIRISDVKPLKDFNVELTLTTGEVVQRDLRPFLNGPIFDSIREDEEQFRHVRAKDGTVVWPNGADLCPDVVIWGGLPPADSSSCAADERASHS
jgi:hypothetical protein